MATLALLTVGIVGAGSTAASAHSGDDDRVTVTGACSSGADWKLEVKTDDGRLEVEGEVNGQTCRGVVNH